MKYVWSDMLRMQLAIEHVLSSGQYSIEHLWGYSCFLQSNKSPYRDNHNMKDWTDWFKTWKYIDESKVPGILLSIVYKSKKKPGKFFSVNAHFVILSIPASKQDEMEQAEGHKSGKDK